MSIQLGQTAPDFEQDSNQGKIRFHEWLGQSWGILFSHPKDFTPVCTTELGEAARLAPEWEKRNVKVIGLSVDTGENHKGWEADISETQGQTVKFPILADADRKVSTLYGMIHPEADPNVTVRAVFIIDPNKKVRLTLTYPPSTGRNFKEILRVVDSLQTSDKFKVATPVNWEKGGEAIIPPSTSDDAAKEQFPQGWKTLKPYLRVVKLPEEA
ncbi:Peroxidase [Granulibacter bethesdensis]|uniref:Peroxidase n=1 Tax=Granulibacter bethesdensis TaxID=364410 RepID=A0AAC9K9P7_9PROT|nr:peroxiredoxin [Granulibacter bethesdensis]APH54164.1 Peroxidase [Granulibacter bethesdensis]APH61746.1 Peroxidase [Granulibacter bethesdensis]